MANKLTTWLVGILSLLAGLGSGVQLTENDFDNAYVCSLTDDVQLFNKLSQNGQIGYYKENDTEKTLECKLGDNVDSWIPLKEYVSMKDINTIDLIKMSGQNLGKTWECNLDNCYMISKG